MEPKTKTKPTISRPKIRDSIIPQHQVERGDDELAFMLKERNEDSDVDEITSAYIISKYQCPCKHEFLYVRCSIPNVEFESFKDAFHHYRHEHYQPITALSYDDSIDVFRELAKRQYEEELATKREEYESAVKVYGAARSTRERDDYRRLKEFEDVIINTRTSNLREDIERHKERHYRIYAMFQYFVIVETNRVGPGRTPRKILNQRRERKYSALYSLAKDFLFTDAQMAAMFDIPVNRMREYLYYGLDAYYGGEENYPDWMKRLLQS
jgi:hypothetical protein